MKNNRLHYLLVTLIWMLIPFVLAAQQWPTTRGNNMKNGYSRITGPSSVEIAWTVSSAYNSVFGNSVFICGDRFVTARTMFSPVYHGILECRKTSNGDLLWTFQPSNTAIMYAIGFDEHAVYAHDYSDGTLYALDPMTGDVKWTYPNLYLFGGNTGLVFSCEGDPMYTNYRFNRKTGDVIWYNNYNPTITPNPGFAYSGSTFYHYHGAINTPKYIIAIDGENGMTKYQTFALPGDADQEEPIIVGPGNVVYLKRDGANFWAFKDTGQELVEIFNTSNAPLWYVAIDQDSTLVGVFDSTLYRLSHHDGEIIASSPFEVAATRPLITIDKEGKIYVNIAQAGTGKIMCISPDLQSILWETAAPYAYYCDPNLSKDGLMILTKNGTQIVGIQNKNQITTLAPVADFYTWTRDIHPNSMVQFYDNSSYTPQSWEWTFEGGTPATSTQQYPVVQYQQPGSYAVTLKVTNAHGEDQITKTCYINVDESVSTGNLNNNSSVIIYPNPFSDLLHLKVESGDTKKPTAEITDYLGRIVLRVNLSPSGTTVVNLTNLQKGIYFVKVYLDDKTVVRKIMKQ